MTEPQPHSHRRLNIFKSRWVAAGGVVVLAAVVGIALLLQNGGSACAAPPSTSEHQGKATFYDLSGMGNCSYPSAPADDLFVALGPAEYSGAAACGTYLDVTGPKGTVRVKVADSCPECAAGHLDLSHTAFKRIGAEIAGIIPITYQTVVSPPVPGPLTVRIKEGSSQYWFAALIDNHGNQLTSVSVAGPGGTFRTANRADYNYWVIDAGAGPGPFKIKATDVYGRSTTVTGVTMSPGRVQQTGGRFVGSAGAPNGAGSAATPKKTTATPKPAKSSVSPSGAPSSAAPLVESTVAGVATVPAQTAVDLAAAAASAPSCG